MKKLILLLIILAPVSLLAQTGTSERLSQKNGFKNFVLGSDKSAVTAKLESVGNKDGLDSYSVDEDSLMNMGGVIPLKAIALSYYKNKLLRIMLIFDKSAKYDVLSACLKAYGMYFKNNQYDDIYKWTSPRVSLEVNLDPLRTTNTATFTCEPLQIDYTAYLRSVTTKAASDL